MKVIESVTRFESKGCVLSIGNFDGVHAGHREILTVGRKEAAKRKVELAVMTFEPHPAIVLRGPNEHGVLTPFELKKELLGEAGVDCLVVLKCDAGLLGLSAWDFMNRFLADGLGPAVVVEGRDFNFGSERRGNVKMLRQFGDEAGFEVILVEPKTVTLAKGGARISSTLIRHLLQTGQIADAAAALGRPYRLYGQVVRGRGKGRRLGFPTANIEPAEQIIPAEAVYAGFVGIAESSEQICRTKAGQPAALSVGRSSTYGGDNPLLVEAHILGKKVGDLCGGWLAMDFIERIRNQKKFKTEKALAAQIGADCEKAKKILAAEAKENSKD